MRKTSCLLLTLLTSILLVFPVQATNFITHDDKELQQLKTTGVSPYYKTKNSILSEARKILDQPAFTVTDKTTMPPSGDVHDYISLAIYYWPDPNSSTGLPYVSRDGYINPEKNDLTCYDGHRLDQMTYHVNTLALAYYLTADDAFAKKAADLLDTWFINPATRMNPNLNFGQVRPGKTTAGSSSGIIETSQLINLTDSISMLSTSASFSPSQQAAVRIWFSSYLDWLLTSKLGIKEGVTTNNHSIWYDAQTAVYAHFVGRDALARQILSEVPAKRIAVQIEPDGKMPRELSRTRSKHYTLYNLQAFVYLGRVGDAVDVNLFDYRTADGRGIRTAIDWFIPYALTKEPWPYQEISPFSATEFARYLYLANVHYHDMHYANLLTDWQNSH